MRPIQRGTLESEIESVVVTFIDSGKTEILETKKNSVCHFFSRFKVGSDCVQLRLDWSDINKNGYPVLDADFYDIKSGNKNSLTGTRRNSHHTNSAEGGGRVYSWTFEHYTSAFSVQITWLAAGICNASSSAIGSAIVSKVDGSYF
ncbi:MAG: hypothetical protein M0Q98_13400 [Pseudomonas sp.]|nr:hypothetical protein [Pseudomonas sp.]